MGSRIQTLGSEKLAYIAGFLDGDGCIVSRYEMSKTCTLGYRVSIRVSFTQIYSRREVLDVLYSWVKSGVIAEYQHNNMAEYVIHEQSIVRELVRAISPYLITKREHAKIALKILKLKESDYTLKSLEQMRKYTIAIRALNNYPKRRNLDPVTTEA